MRQGNSRNAAAADPIWHRLLLRAGLSLLISIGFFWLLAQRLSHIDLVDLQAGFAAVPIGNWALALALTGVSFYAVGHYDSVLHRHFNSGLPERQTQSAGICAIAVSQTLGLGLITGAILRWRMLPGQSLWFAVRLTAAVGVSFLAGWAVVTAATLLALPEAPFKGAAVGVLGLALLAFGFSLFAPTRLQFWPNGHTVLRLIALTAIDTLAAAAAFHLLCGPQVDLTFATLLPAFLLAFGAGLVSGTPGGVGPFEVTLLALLPGQAEAPMIAAILAWRAIYYAIPAILGAIWAMRGPKQRQSIPLVAPEKARNFRAEIGLLNQGEHRFHAASAQLIGDTRHFLVGLFDPATPASRQNLILAQTALQDAALNAAKQAVLYKCSARGAVVARQRRASCLRIAQEAWLVPKDFRLTQSNRAGLRRKLRRAEGAGVTVSRPGRHPPLPWTELTRIAQDWADHHGKERGFSMGRFNLAYLSRQRLYVAWQNGVPIAFASFHHAPDEWTLDVMRHGTLMPDGTMHLLVQSAIADAAVQGVARLSLAAAPDCAPRNRLAARLIRGLMDSGNGLTRFKSSFAPQWQPLYLTAPNPFALCLAAAEITRAILHPPPLPPIDDDHVDYEFALFALPWHRQPE